MPRSSSSSSSLKKCPPNKFGFLSGCVSWDTSLTCILLGALILICVLLLNTQQLPYGVKQGDIVESKRALAKQHALTINGSEPNLLRSLKSNERNRNHNNNIVSRVNELFESNDEDRSPHEGTGTPTSERIKYDINVNIRDSNPERPNPNQLSYLQYEANKASERIINPLLPPERSYTNTYGTPINIPSRGPSQSYQQVGILYKETIANTEQQPGNNNETSILPLFGRPTFNGSRKWNYYTSSDKFHNFKIPITKDGRKCNDDFGCDEIMNGDMIDIPSYNGKFKVDIYSYDRPSYIPYVY
tara:strand:- start:45 stop:947 length:903 start_codon:yes stop_codon:yes gene_type:complete